MSRLTSSLYCWTPCFLQAGTARQASHSVMKNQRGTFETCDLSVLPPTPSFARAGGLVQIPAWPVRCRQRRCRRVVRTDAIGSPISPMARVARHAPSAILASVSRGNDFQEPRKAPLAWKDLNVPQSTFVESGSRPGHRKTRNPGKRPMLAHTQMVEVALIQEPHVDIDKKMFPGSRASGSS